MAHQRLPKRVTGLVAFCAVSWSLVVVERAFPDGEPLSSLGWFALTGLMFTVPMWLAAVALLLSLPPWDNLRAVGRQRTALLLGALAVALHPIPVALTLGLVRVL
jgi:hypothetical protein